MTLSRSPTTNCSSTSGAPNSFAVSACPASSRRPSPTSSTGTRSQTSSTAGARRGSRSRSSAEAAGLAVLRVLRLLAALDDVALGEENRLQRNPPFRRSADQELEIHAEMLELLALGVGHDRLRLRVGLERHPLLVPAAGLRLFGQRRDHPGERACLRVQLAGRFVVLVETHLSPPVRLTRTRCWRVSSLCLASRPRPGFPPERRRTRVRRRR